MHRYKYLLILLLLPLLTGCGALFENRTYNRSIPNLPKIKQPPFDDLQSLSAGATTGFLIGDEAYYQVKLNFDEMVQADMEEMLEAQRGINLRLLATLNVNVDNIDYQDAESLDELFRNLEESGKNKQEMEYDYKEQIQELNDTLADKEKYERDLIKEKEGLRTNLFRWIMGVVLTCLLIFGVMMFLQFGMGIPVFRMVRTGGKLFHDMSKQSAAAIQSIRSSMADDANGGLASRRTNYTEDEIAVIQRYAAEKAEEMDAKLNHYQDDSVKTYIKQLKHKNKISFIDPRSNPYAPD